MQVKCNERGMDDEGESSTHLNRRRAQWASACGSEPGIALVPGVERPSSLARAPLFKAKASGAARSDARSSPQQLAPAPLQAEVEEGEVQLVVACSDAAEPVEWAGRFLSSLRPSQCAGL